MVQMEATGVYPLPGVDTIRVRALYLGGRITVRALEKRNLMSVAPLTLRVGQQGCAVIFRYGAVVLFNLSRTEETEFIERLRPYLTEPRAEPELEEVEIHIAPDRKESIQGDIIYLAEVSLQHLQIIADILGKSVVLDYYEQQITRSFELIEPLALRLTRTPLRWIRSRELLRHIGEVLIMEHEMVGRIEVSEKPELLWDHPELERLYTRMETEFEIRERHRALERKLALISRTAETVLDILQSRRSLRLEWYIVFLILVEIMISLYEKLFQAGA